MSKWKRKQKRKELHKTSCCGQQMTNKEAIAEFKERLAITDYKELIPEYYEAMELAIEALDKQIPKKPVSKYKYRDGENVCPSCETENRYRIVMFWEKFCPDCGQAIDWEEEE